MASVANYGADQNGAVSKPDPAPLLGALGARVRALRKRRAITRKALSAAAGVSERHLANLESGEGNVSVVVLAQVAAALDCPLAELLGDITTRSPEWLLLRELLANRDETTLRRVRGALEAMLAEQSAVPARRIALIGLRGAGKSTLGAMLARRLELPFVELSREIEKLAACSIGEIQALYGMTAYRRYERRALDDVIRDHHSAVIAVPGGLVSEPDTYDRLLSNCGTVWLEAAPEDHMQRVVEQGDFRPMRGNREAMRDLRSILAARRSLYARAQYRLDTSAQDREQTFAKLCALALDIEQSAPPAALPAQNHLEEISS